MPALNQVTLAGHLGRDAEIKFAKNGEPWARFSVAITERYKAGNEWKEQTTWVNCKWWGCYENASEWLTKGRGVTITGKLSVNSYESKDGTKRNDLEVRVLQCWPADGSFAKKRESDDRPMASKPVETQQEWGGAGEDDLVPF